MGERGRALFRRPLTWHLLSLAAAAALLLVLAGGQWFFYDEWAFIDGTTLLEPHGGHSGHWSTAPILIYQGLLAIFGLHTYLPYMVVLVVVHLAATHLIWQVALRAGANPWIATAAVAGFAVFGTGAENLLWAFQIGFIGAVAVGLTAFLLAMSPTLSWRRLALVAAVALFSLLWSGTAIPLVVATAVLILVRHGWRKALTIAVITGGVYLAWYVAYAEPAVGGVDQGALTFHKVFVAMPEFIGVLLIFGFGDVFPIPGLGFALLLAVAAWIVVLLVRKVRLPAAAPAFVLLGASALFAFMTAYSRAVLSVPSGRSSRYVYLVMLLLIPLLTLALSRAVTRLFPERRSGTVSAAALLLMVMGYQVFLLATAAAVQSERELPTERLFSAALELYVNGAPNVHLNAWPDPIWAPDIQMYELVELYDEGKISIGPYTREDALLAQFYLAR